MVRPTVVCGRILDLYLEALRAVEELPMSLGAVDFSAHTGEELYPNAQAFDGFNFLKLREKEGDVVLAARHHAW